MKYNWTWLPFVCSFGCSLLTAATVLKTFLFYLQCCIPKVSLPMQTTLHPSCVSKSLGLSSMTAYNMHLYFQSIHIRLHLLANFSAHAAHWGWYPGLLQNLHGKCSPQMAVDCNGRTHSQYCLGCHHPHTSMAHHHGEAIHPHCGLTHQDLFQAPCLNPPIWCAPGIESSNGEIHHTLSKHTTKTLLQAANTTEPRLPTLAKYMNNGTNGLCYAYILGTCQVYICGKYAEGHTLVSDITDSFAQDLSQVLSSGIKQPLATKPPTKL